MIFYDNQAELLCDSAPGIGTVITLKIPEDRTYGKIEG